MHYYYLAGLFGGVPQKLEETRTIDNPPLPRATAEATWSQIFTDLSEAAAGLPASWPSSDYGRATSGAAYALLGKAYLQSAATTNTPAHYTEALEAFRQIQGDYSLDPDYASLFTGNNERSPEILKLRELHAVRAALQRRAAHDRDGNAGCARRGHGRADDRIDESAYACTARCLRT